MATVAVAVPGALLGAYRANVPMCRVVCNSSRNGLPSPLRPLVLRISRGFNVNRSTGHWRPVVMVAQKAAQTEAEEEEGETEVVEEATEEPNGVAYSSLLEGLKEALAANDETRIAELEAQLRAIEEERDSLGKLVSTMTEEIQTAKERFLRLNADFDNFRKRSEQEKSQISNNVRGDVIETLLPMVDNFERAKASIRTETEGEQKIDRSYQGIYKQFVEIMKGLGVFAVETVGKEFDPNVHEAIMREESIEFADGIVIQEFRRGFLIGSKLLRPAMVKVSSGPGPVPASQEVPEEEVPDVVQQNSDAE